MQVMPVVLRQQAKASDVEQASAGPIVPAACPCACIPSRRLFACCLLLAACW